MSIAELFLIAVGLSMDAFAVSICKGLSQKRLKPQHMLLTGLWFGGFQFLMPVIGYSLGNYLTVFIKRYSHWAAFLILVFIGAGMIREARSPEEKADPSFAVSRMLPLAVATSMDALAVGASFAFLGMKILAPAGLIGCTTFLISAAGVKTGNLFGSRYRSRAELAGGCILILIGGKILLEGIGIM